MDLTPDLLLQAYALGIFPMAEGRESTDLYWMDPQQRGIFPLQGFHISRSLARAIRRADYRVTLNADFDAVMQGCADRPETWINAQICEVYGVLHRVGHAQSLEVWDGPALIGGVYGVTLGAAFFGESMFSRRTNASKIALAYLTCHLRKCGYRLFDTQYLTPHLASLGAIEVEKPVYQRLLASAIEGPERFDRYPSPPSVAEVLQRSTHTS